jgi:hypothetical protein
VQDQPAVRPRVGAHPAVALRRQGGQLRDEGAGVVEELLRPVRAQPRLKHGEVARVVVHVGDRDLVRAPRALDLDAVDHVRPGPALRRPEHDHRPARPLGVGAVAGPAGPGGGLDRGDLVEHPIERLGQLAVDLRRVVAGHDVDGVAVALEELHELRLRDPGEDGRVGDLVAVEVEDRQHGAVMDGVEELVGVPARGQRAGLRLAVADHAGDHQPRVVERRPVGVHQRVAELPALVDRPRPLGRVVARDAAGEAELAEQAADSV